MPPEILKKLLAEKRSHRLNNFFNPFGSTERRLTFDEGGNGGGGGDGGDKGKKGDDEDDDDDKKKAKNSAEARIKQLSDDKKELQRQIDEQGKTLKELLDADKARKEDEGKKKGEFEKLYNEKSEELKQKDEKLQSLEKELESSQNALQVIVDQGLEKISEENKELVNELLDGKPIDKKISLLPKLIEKYGEVGDDDKKKQGFGGQKPPGGDNKGNNTNPDVNEKVKRFKELIGKSQNGDRLSPQERLELNNLRKDIEKLKSEGKIESQYKTPERGYGEE